MARRARSQVVREYYVRLGARVSKLRRERRMTARECAERLGISATLLYQYEVGNVAIPIHLLVEVGKLFGVSLAALVRNQDNLQHSCNRESCC